MLKHFSKSQSHDLNVLPRFQEEANSGYSKRQKDWLSFFLPFRVARVSIFLPSWQNIQIHDLFIAISWKQLFMHISCKFHEVVYHTECPYTFHDFFMHLKWHEMPMKISLVYHELFISYFMKSRS